MASHKTGGEVLSGASQGSGIGSGTLQILIKDLDGHREGIFIKSVNDTKLGGIANTQENIQNNLDRTVTLIETKNKIK